MSKTESVKHTPGPWDDASNYPEFNSVRIFAGTHYIATVGNSDDTKEQTEANARLIAAAPELLEACRDAFEVWHNLGKDNALQMTLRAVIAKAEGRA